MLGMLMVPEQRGTIPAGVSGVPLLLGLLRLWGSAAPAWAVCTGLLSLREKQ